MARRRRGTIAGAAVALPALLALTACWPIPGHDPSRTAHNGAEGTLTPASVGGLSELWASAPAPGPLRDPVVSGAGVVASTGSSLHSVDADTGASDWTWQPDDETPYPVVVSAPVVVGGRVLVGSGIGGGGGIWTGTWLDPASGAETGTLARSGLVQSVRGTRAISTSYGHGSGTPVAVDYQVVDTETGVVATSGLLELGELGDDLVPDVTLGGARVYHAGYGMLPPASPGGPLRGGQGVRAFPASGGSSTCGPIEYPRFACPVWVTEVGGSPTAPVLGPGERVVYVGSSGGTVAALDAATGALLWTADVGAAVHHPPALADGVLYVPTADGDLVAVDADGCGNSTCAPLWTATTGTAAVSTQPAVGGSGADAVVYAATAGGQVLAFAAAGCGDAVCSTPLWSGATAAPVTGGPVVTGGRVYVATDDGRLVAYGLPAG
jgi:outer membrane protein assembly factor BamB